jgi:hypothetical protein
MAAPDNNDLADRIVLTLGEFSFRVPLNMVDSTWESGEQLEGFSAGGSAWYEVTVDQTQYVSFGIENPNLGNPFYYTVVWDATVPTHAGLVLLNDGYADPYLPTLLHAGTRYFVEVFTYPGNVDETVQLVVRPYGTSGTTTNYYLAYNSTLMVDVPDPVVVGSGDSILHDVDDSTYVEFIGTVADEPRNYVSPQYGTGAVFSSKAYTALDPLAVVTNVRLRRRWRGWGHGNIGPNFPSLYNLSLTTLYPGGGFSMNTSPSSVVTTEAASTLVYEDLDLSGSTALYRDLLSSGAPFGVQCVSGYASHNSHWLDSRQPDSSYFSGVADEAFGVSDHLRVYEMYFVVDTVVPAPFPIPAFDLAATPGLVAVEFY